MTDIKQRELEKALENCASEPIHRIGSIQPHGALLVLNPDDDYKIVRASENVGDFIGVPHDILLETTFSTWVDDVSFNHVIAMMEVVERRNTATGKLNFDCKNIWQVFDVHLYKSDSFYVLELIIDDGNHKEVELANLLFEMEKSQLIAGDGANVIRYLDYIATLVREMTGHDSVMVYRFDEDWNGEIICQSRVESSPSYQGMHFPASDIPAQARRLYTINLVRILADVEAVPVSITPVLNCDTGESLDMSYSVLRSLSPIHMEYLRNIGIKASMVMSLLQNGKLWGLIVCHHNSPKRVSIAMREAAIFISKFVSEKLTFIEAIQHKFLIEKAIQLSEALHESLIKSSIEQTFPDMLPKLQSLLNATGIVAVIQDEKYFHGNVPTPSETDALLEWLRKESPDKLFSCIHLESIYEPASNYKNIVSGLLAVSLFGNMRNCIVWFRTEKIRTIQWAGKYEEGFIQNDVGDFRLTPRKSFDLWTELWRGRSASWLPTENGVAVVIGGIVSDAFSDILKQAYIRQSSDYIRQSSEWQIASIALNKKTQENFDKLTLQLPGVLYQFRLFPDGRSCFPYASNGINDIYEVTLDQILTDASAVFAVVHPKDYDIFVNSIHQSAKKLEIWKLEYRVNLPRKGLRWLSAIANPERLDDGSTLWHGFISDITEHKKIKEENDKNLTLFLNASDGIAIVSENGNILDCSDSFYAMLGYSRKQIIGMHVSKFDVGGIPEGEIMNFIQALFKQNKRIEFETLHMRKNGTIYNASVTARLVELNGERVCFCSTRDITSQKRISAERERLLKIIDESSDFIGMADMQANLKYLNATAKKLVGLPDNADISKLKINNMHPEWATNLILNEGVPAVLKNGFWKGENAVLNRVGNFEIPVSQIMTVHYDEKGEPQLFSTIMRDISKEKEVEKELLKVKEAAEAATKAKSNFIANISHEIRTPMNAILGFSEILSTLITESTHKYYLKAIQSSGKTLLQLINDILDISKIEADKIMLQCKPISIKNIVDDITIIFSQQAIQKKLRFCVSMDKDFPCCVLLDEIRLRQVFLNLVGNAMKFTHDGEIEITLSVLYEHPNGKEIDLFIDILDSGIGIPESQQEKIFSAFTQQDEQSIEYGGTGLGLTICKRLLQLMNGQIFVNSKEGEGSCFSIILKNVLVCDDENKERQNQKMLDKSSIKRIEFEPAKILLVDDVGMNRELVRAYLAEFHELSFVEASTGEEALSMAQQHSFDLIFMDRVLPGIDGDSVCQQIKSINPYIPIIMISASIVKESGNPPPIFYDIQLSKPINKDVLLKSIRAYLKIVETEIEPDDFLKPENKINVPIIEPEKLTELLIGYKEKFREIKSSEGFNVSALVETAEQLVQIADKHHYPLLKEWANTMKTQANLFDSVNLGKTLSCFDKLCLITR